MQESVISAYTRFQCGEKDCCKIQKKCCLTGSITQIEDDPKHITAFKKPNSSFWGSELHSRVFSFVVVKIRM